MYSQDLENCILNLTMLDFKAASADLKPVIEEVINDESGVTDIEHFIEGMSYVLAELSRRLPALKERNQAAEDYRVCLTDCIRAMRNCCGVNALMQNRFGTNVGILNLVRKLLEGVREHCSGDERVQTLAVGAQFLGNATMGDGSEASHERVWNIFQHQLKPWMLMGSEKLTNHACLIVNNCLKTQVKLYKDFLENPNSLEILQTAARMCVAYEIDFGMLAVEKMLQVKGLFEKILKTFGHLERMFVLEVLNSRMSGWERKLSGHSAPPQSSPPVDKSNLSFMCEQIQEGTTAFEKLKDRDAWRNEHLAELIKYLEILSKATAFDVYERMSDHKDFLSCVIGLLKNVQEWGKSGNNMLSRHDKPDKAKQGATPEVDEGHPGYLLRRDLVRIISNMSFRHKENQDLVREVGGIPLILDHAVIDDRNPFITQWTEMAIRNLCEGNLENVKFIKDMKIQGIANPGELLSRFGITVEADGERVVVRSARPNASPSKAILGRKPST